MMQAFCEQYNIQVAQDSAGRWRLSYKPPLAPWIVLYVVGQLGEFPLMQIVEE